MKILTAEIIRGKDFKAVMECEGCGNQQNLNSGYNDSYYHSFVIPKMKCEKCNLSRNDLSAKTENKEAI